MNTHPDVAAALKKAITKAIHGVFASGELTERMDTDRYTYAHERLYDGMADAALAVYETVVNHERWLEENK